MRGEMETVKYKWLLYGAVIAGVYLVLLSIIYWTGYDTQVTVASSEFDPEELLVVREPYGDRMRQSFIDREGRVVINGSFYEASEFSDGIALVSVERRDGSAYNNIKKGYLLPDGTWLIKPRFDHATPFSGGLAIVSNWQGCFVINTKGERVARLDKGLFPEGTPFVNGIAPVAVKNGRWRIGAVNTAGELVLPPAYKAVYFSEDGLGTAYDGDRRTHIFDAQGNVLKVIEEMYVSKLIVDGHVSMFRDGLAFIRYGEQGEVVFLDSALNEKLRLAYDYASYFSDGLAPVGKDSRYGFINEAGKVVIPLRYEAALPFSEGLAAVKQDDLFGYINTAGEWVIKPQFDAADSFKNGAAVVRRDIEKHDEAGNIVAKYMARAYIDKQGNFIWKEEGWD